MKKVIFFSILLLGFGLSIVTHAGRGCCSRHGGQAYCGSNGMWQCNDGTQSPTCSCYVAPKKPAYTTPTYIIPNYVPAQPTIEQLNASCKKTYPGTIYRANDKIGCACLGDSTGYSSWDPIYKNCPNNIVCGINKIYNKYSRSCECIYGYQLGSDGKTCKLEVKKTPTQLCQDEYGANIHSDGIANTNGSYNCSCDVGYQWLDDKNRCESNTKAPSTQICMNLFGSHIYSDGTKALDGTYNCYCSNGYQWSSGNKFCELSTKDNLCENPENVLSCALGLDTCPNQCIFEGTNNINTGINLNNNINRYKAKICRPENSSKGDDNYCYCKTGYILSKTKYSCTKE